MGLIKKVATLGAVAAAGLLVANRDKVAKVVKGALTKAPVKKAIAKAPAKAKAAARSAAKSAEPRIKKEPHAKAPRAERRKARRAHRHAATT